MNRDRIAQINADIARKKAAGESLKGVKPDKGQRVVIATPRQRKGPGTELKKLITEIGGQPRFGCSCESLAAKMNVWGVVGCRKHRDEIGAGLAENADKMSLIEWATTAIKAATHVFEWSLNPLDPYGSLVDEAIRRASLS